MFAKDLKVGDRVAINAASDSDYQTIREIQTQENGDIHLYLADIPNVPFIVSASTMVRVQPIDFVGRVQRLSAKRGVIADSISQEFYLSGLLRRCKNCGYSDTIEIPPEADTEDIIAAMEMIKFPCPVCEEERKQAPHNGLEPLTDEEDA